MTRNTIPIEFSHSRSEARSGASITERQRLSARCSAGTDAAYRARGVRGQLAPAQTISRDYLDGAAQFVRARLARAAARLAVVLNWSPD
jgi:hypothetical protein